MKRAGYMLIVVLISGMLIYGLGICLRQGAVVNAQQVPYLINYQGKLTDSSGAPLNGDYDMTFLLYTDETGGAPIWSEQQTVTVTDGLLNAKLGEGTGDTTLSPDIFETDTLYLEVQIENQSGTVETMTPRHRLTSTAFAMKAESAGSAGASGGNSLGAADGDPADVVFVDDNGNVGIGTTSPSYALHVAGDIYATGTIHGGSGTGDTDWVESGGNIYRESGKVGIGTTNPTQLLQIGFADGVNTIDGQLVLGKSTTSGGRLFKFGIDENYNLSIGDYKWSGAESYSPYLTIKYDNGNVGIGTTDPGEYKLNVNGNVMFQRSGNAVLNLHSDKAAIFILEDGDAGVDQKIFHIACSEGALHFRARNDDGSYRINPLTLTSDGKAVFADKVGIGNTNPQYPLDLGLGGGVKRLALLSNGNDFYGFGVSGSTLEIYSGMATGTEDPEMVIKSYGKVGIGTVSPSGKLHVHTDDSNGTAVTGIAANTGANKNHGGYFKSSGTCGIGVYAEATGGCVPDPDTRRCEGCDGESVAVYGKQSYISHSWGIGVKGEGYRGVEGKGRSYDFYASGSGLNYGPFTGGHEVIISDDCPTEIEPGMVFSVTGKTEIRSKEDGTASLSSTLPTVRLSDTSNDKKVFGVLVSEAPLPEDHWYRYDAGERFAVVNALGEGRVLVTNINGDIEPGDYITTSVIPGYGQKQDDDFLHSYTLGKAIESVDWDSVTETIEYNGQVFKVYLIAIVYTSG